MATRRKRQASRKAVSPGNEIALLVAECERTFENATLLVSRLKRMARSSRTDWDDALEAERALFRMNGAFREVLRAEKVEDVREAARGVCVTSDTILQAAARQTSMIAQLIVDDADGGMSKKN